MSDIRTDVRTVSGGNIPDGVSYKVNVTIDYTNTSRDELIDRAFRGDVIKLQGGWRKLPKAELVKLQENGAKMTGDEVSSGTGVKKIDVHASLLAMGLSEEEAKLFATNVDMVKELLLKSQAA